MTNSAPRILVVDDTPYNLKLLQAIFELEGFSVALADGGAAALAQLGSVAPDIVMLDLRMPGMDGIETLGKLKAMAPALPVIMLTSDADVAAAVETIKAGAEDFLIRPIQSDHLVLRVRRTLERHALKSEVENLRQLVQRQGYLARLMTASPRMRELANQIQRVADSNFTVLIQGETGTGKELVARAIHQESPRSNNPFIAIDAGAIPETLIESELFGYEKGAFSGAERRKEGHFQTAKAGTLFLDELANLPFSSQPKLLRAIQERQIMPMGATRAIPVDVRLIAASNDSLDDSISKGTFREDLYYRLAEFVISLPPLRGRREDILPLAQAFLSEATVELKRPASVITEPAAALLHEYNWPGNIRQLRNVMRRVALQTTSVSIEPDDLRPLLGPVFHSSVEPVAAAVQASSGPAPAVPINAVSNGHSSLGDTSVGDRSLKDIGRIAIEAAEKQAIMEALSRTYGNKQKAAQLLRTDYKTLFVKLKRYGLGNAQTKIN